MKNCSVKNAKMLVPTFAICWLMVGCSATQDYKAILKHPERPETERALDAARKPEEVLAFYGVKSGDKVADIWAARGYYTALLSQVVGPQGVVYSVNPAPRPEWSDRFKKPEFANVRLVTSKFETV
ncbi:MAG TPA: hypothetical protein VFM35_05570, partial [Candidatus Binatia bacterium]|nr:hypothetical protein [Candidatus Binatia bacterium]